MEFFTAWFSETTNVIDVVQIFVSSVTAVAAIALVIVTVVLVLATKQKPFVVCVLGPSPYIGEGLNVVIRNTGNATAFDIEANFKANTDSPTDKKELNLNFAILTPGQVLHPYDNLNDWEKPIKIYVTVSWALKPNGRKQKPLEYIIDYSEESNHGWSEDRLKNVTHELKSIARTLDTIRTDEQRRDVVRKEARRN